MTCSPASEPTSAARLLSALAEIAGELSADLSPLEVVHQVLRRGTIALGAAGGASQIVDARGERVDAVDLGAMANVPAAAADLVSRGEEAWLSTSEAIVARLPGTTPGGVGALASMPVDASRCVGGVVFWFDDERAFPDFERSFLGALGLILAQEVNRSTLLAQQRSAESDRAKKARWADALGEAFRLSTSRASLSRILDELARVSCETPADYAAIRVFSADRRSLEFRALYHRDPERRDGLRAALAESSTPAMLGDTARVLETGESVLVPTVDMDRLSRCYAGTSFGDYIARFPVSSVVLVPLSSRGSIFGVLNVARVGREPFEPADLGFLQEVADRATLALDTQHLLEELTRSEEHLRVALEAGRLGAWEWEIAAGKVSWSTMLESIHGFDEGEFPGTFEAYQHDIHPDDRDLVIATIARTVEARTDYHVVYRIIRRDGETRWLEAKGRLLCDPRGAPQRLVGVCCDVTAQRKAEAHLHQTLLALKEADRRKDQFLAMLAHELRNPLGPMLNATHLLGMPDVGEDAAGRAREILDRQVHHMARLLDDLLDVSRITRGKIEILREPIDLAALSREVVADHLGSFHAAGLGLELTVSAGATFVHADRTRIAQIVGNLLSNALKFSQRGQTVRLRIDHVDASQPMAVISVRDEGAGIQPELLGSVFEPFVQADTSLSRARGGLGLGLAVVKGLVDLHGGRVSASSAGSGHGTELRVELPRMVAPQPVAASSDELKPGLGACSSAAVLVFEDNADAAESLHAVLAAAGYRVWVEATGLLAIEAVKRSRPAVVLCDLGLPDRDGYGIAEDIRADREFATLPLIALSGYGSTEDQARSRRAGFDLHLTKPVSPSRLLSELAHCLSSRASAADGRHEP